MYDDAAVCNCEMVSLRSSNSLDSSASQLSSVAAEMFDGDRAFALDVICGATASVEIVMVVVFGAPEEMLATGTGRRGRQGVVAGL